MKLLALIPARGGSKRLPGKNILPLGDKPLIAWTIVAALESKIFADVLVSTDDPAIADIARTWGAQAPWLRPPELATDSAGSVEVVLHALDWYEKEYGAIDSLMLLQPTSPFRKPETIQAALRKFMAGEARSLVTVSPASPPPAWCFHEENGTLVPLLGWEELMRRSQDLKPAYVLNGAIYVSTPDSLRENKTFLTRDTRFLLIDDPFETIDIDTHFDWTMAEFFLQQMLANKDGQAL